MTHRIVEEISDDYAVLRVRPETDEDQQILQIFIDTEDPKVERCHDGRIEFIDLVRPVPKEKMYTRTSNSTRKISALRPSP